MPLEAIDRIPDDILDIPGYVVDLGFAKSRSSVGLALHRMPDSAKTHRFSEVTKAINTGFETLEARGESRAFLVIEAPLTFAFTAEGNPCHRNIELRRNYSAGYSPVSPKGWFYQAGANLSLASILLLRGLKIPTGLTVFLAEAFFCSTARGEAHTDDDVVAESMLAALLSSGGSPLVIPVSEHDDRAVAVLPGLENILRGVPGVLLRPSLKLKPFA